MHTLNTIAVIRTDFKEKFGIPRQSGIVNDTIGRIVFEPCYRNRDALRGLDGYSHLWLIWGFSEHTEKPWSPTVRPPRLGGNRRMGVFATRSPFRPNPIGLSCVRFCGLEETAEGWTILVGGGDLLDGTPIYDIKPYLPYTDSRPDAVGGFADAVAEYALSVSYANGIDTAIASCDRAAVHDLIAHDPRPSYQNDPDRVYYLKYKHYELGFTVADGCATISTIRLL